MTKQSTPGRRKIAPAPINGPQFVGKTPEDDARKEAAMRKEMDRVVAKYGEGIPYNRDHYIAEIRRDMVRTIEFVFNIGRRLIVMKAHEAHGQWLTCLQSIGIGADNAQRMMAAARRVDSLPAGGSAQKLLTSTGTPSKLFDMLALSDDELTKIGDGETAIDPDDIEQMTVNQLRKALRDLREDFEAKDKKLGETTERNVKLKEDVEAEKRRWRRTPPDEQRVKLELAVMATATAAKADFNAMREAVLNLLNHGDGETGAAFCGRVIAELLVELQLVRDDETLPVAIPVLTIAQADG